MYNQFKIKQDRTYTGCLQNSKYWLYITFQTNYLTIFNLKLRQPSIFPRSCQTLQITKQQRTEIQG